MRALNDADFDASRPLQTRRGAAQALRIGENSVDQLIKEGRLKAVRIGRQVRITTESILRTASEVAD